MGLIAVDSSVLVAILKSEPEKDNFEDVLIDSQCVIGWPTAFETRIWTIRNLKGSEEGWLEKFLAGSSVTIASFDQPLEALAAKAFRQFGKGRHSAKLNFGDCMAYAVAKHFDAPLLFKGNDFQHTDVTVHADSIVTD
jgi:ribonuclease VapC